MAASQSLTTIELDPAASTWAGLMRAPNSSARAQGFREELGLPTEAPIVMAGHQAQLWHPGILAKLFAADALATRTGGRVVWLVVDMDNNDALTLRVPTRSGEGPMQRTTIDFTPTSMRGVQRPTGLAEAVRPAPIELGEGIEPASEAFAERLVRAHEALARHAGEASVARQVTRALFELLSDVIDTPTIVYPSDFVKTAFFEEIIALASEDPGGFAGGFNEAVDAEPDSGVATVSLAREELPLWRVDERGRRHRARAADLQDRNSLLPGGLLMTGMMRAAGCDLFIHGTGGRKYEPINDQWLAPILEQKLAPFTTATASLTLQFDDGGVVTRQEARRAVWEAHHARHQPAMLDEDALQRQKLELVRTIESLPRRSPERAERYGELLSLLESMRRAHAEELAEYRERAHKLSRRALEADLREDRTWSVVLHDPDDLRVLRDRIDRAFGA